MTLVGNTWFRYVGETINETWNGPDHRITLVEFEVVAETKHTVLLVSPHYARQYPDLPDWVKKHRVLKDARKRFAYPTKALALNSFRIRQAHRETRLTFDLDCVRAYRAMEAVVTGLLHGYNLTPPSN